MLSWLGLLTEPAALLGWALIVLTWLMVRGPAGRGARYLAVTVTGVYFVVATPLGANLAVGALELAVPEDVRCLVPGDDSIIVVLAGGQSGEPESADDIARLQEASLRRTIEGVRLAQRASAVPLVLSGGTGAEVREADLMESLVLRLGFPAGRIVKERDSRNTADAATAVAHLPGLAHGTKRRVHLVTSALHMPRAAGAFRRQGLEVCPVAVEHRLVVPAVYEALIPQISALRKTTEAYHEAAGYVMYRLTGKL
jgi:uncharacterized SAM-binding protein YcdF (DUF218 family)